MSTWIPDVDEVLAQIPTRGPFDETSRPTRTEVQTLAVSVARGLLLEIGEGRVLVGAQIDVARSYVAHATAARIEWNWFPEQQDDNGPGRQHDLWAAAERARLRRSFRGTGAGGPVFSFPPPPDDRVWGRG